MKSAIRPWRRRLLFATAALPLFARAAFAQAPARPPRIGVVEFGGPPDGGFVRAYLAALARLGYAEPRTLQVERRYAQGDATRFAGLLQDLAAREVDLVLTVGNDIAQIAKRVAPSLSVVTAGSEDPIMSGLIREYRRPGGNITGVTYLSPQLAGKRLELLKEAVPRLARVAVLWDPTHLDTYYRDMESAAGALGVRLQLFEVRNAEEIEDAIAASRKAGAESLFVAPSRMINLESKRICQLALANRLPVMAAYANFTEAGGLMSYGAIAADMLQRAAVQTAQIFKGAKAGDLPYELPATFELVINKKTAASLGLAIPMTVLLRADRVIE